MNFGDAIEGVLRNDPIIDAEVGRDLRDYTKVYRAGIVPDDVMAPFIVWAITGGTDPVGTYSDHNAIEVPELQITPWCLSEDHSWFLTELVFDLLRPLDLAVELFPYKKISMIRQGYPVPITDRDTKWHAVNARYLIGLGR